MRNRDQQLAVLQTLREEERTARLGWVLDDQVTADSPKMAEAVVRDGLVELADRDTRAELSAQVSRPVRWAARLTSYGRDVLVYAHNLPRPVPDLDEPAPRNGGWSYSLPR
ncbi:DUF6417 family protein [Streptomyces tailanensis]|uniref:DUF6417 family protein n=1 Tax=Streptomyces tailanensis TaxID=2569858 RepID=UPI001C0F338D|nr:DUF6417 family protein [Streptomyces tailanensis]